MNEIKEFLLNKGTVKIIEKGKSESVILWGTAKEDSESLIKAAEYLENMLAPDMAYTLISFETSDWFSDFSPWKMVTDSGEIFEGKGENTLSFLKKELLPFINEKFPHKKNIYIAGYSLSGLFSLWAFYETGLFNGAACCSGSLWYENWDLYRETKSAPSDSIIYLSLGGKESTSKNKYMATIFEQYKKEELRIKKDMKVTKHIFEMNSGGHFANPEKRMAKAFFWLIKNS